MKFKILFLFIVVLNPVKVFSLQELTLYQSDRKIIIDGKLDDWGGIEKIPVNLTPSGEKNVPSADINVEAMFTFDVRNFYACIISKDDKFEFPNRSWRYGDGLYLTFVDPYRGNGSDRSFSYGFSIQGKRATKVLVYRDGKYFPEMSVAGINAKIISDSTTKTITYEISLPWKYIIPFKPFIHKRWGINLIYVDRDFGQRKILQLYPDPDYDTELTDIRKGAIFNFVPHIPEDYEFQIATNGFHFYQDTEKVIICAINSPGISRRWRIEYELGFKGEIFPHAKYISLKKGMNIFRLILKNKNYSTGVYNLKVRIIDNKNSIKFKWWKEFFILNRGELESYYLRINRIRGNIFYINDTVVKESIPVVEIRLKWIEKFMESATPFADIKQVYKWYQEFNELIERLGKGRPALFPPGRIMRLAHRSKIDSTLQPYSVFLPENYDDKKVFPLFVTLHGSGVDERATIRYVSRVLKKWGNWIVLAPRARGLSDWYLGNSGKDVIECIHHIEKLFNIDKKRIILDGFSMGGYGAWRLGLLYPELFRAIIIRSGAIHPPAYLKGENIIELVENGKNKNFFIVHGDKDNAVDVQNARKIVQKLKKLGIKFKYIEVKGAAHGGYNKWKEILKWLENIMKQ